MKIRDRIREFQRIPAAALMANERNWRTHPKAQQDALAGLLQQVGIANAVIAYESERYGGLTLIDGHLRIDTHEGEWPVLILDVNDEEADLLLATMDPLGAMAGADAERVTDLLGDVQSDSPAVRALLDDLGERHRTARTPGLGGDEFDVTPQPEAAQAAPGQIWALGDHRLFVGDCTDAEGIARLMGCDRAALGFTSPPYNVGDNAALNGEESKYIVGDDDALSGGEYFNLLRDFTTVALRHCHYLMVNLQMVAGNKIVLVDYLYHFRNHLADVAIWDKQNASPAMARRVMNSQFEFVFGFILAPKDMPSRAIGTADFRGTVSNVYSAPSQRNNEYADLHAATFPLHFPTWYIENLTQWGEVIYEPFGGTGTTLIAAERTGRRCRIVEREPLYADVIIRRWEAETGRTAELVNL